MSIEISIIVPVYNLQTFLPKCIESILSQTFTHFELILVNDGSPDGSGEICDQYAKQDSRVKVIHKENGGTASSRNAGLKKAQGKYIGFVDNDDFINQHMLEVLYHQIKRCNADIVMCDYAEIYEDDERLDFKKEYNIQHFNNIKALNELYQDNSTTFVVPWNKLYKRELFDGLTYTHGNINDDETIIHHLLYRSKKITYLKTKLYYYFQRPNSQMNGLFHIKYFDAIYAFKERATFFEKVKQQELHRQALKHYMDKFFYYYYTAKKQLSDVETDLKNLKRTFNKSLYQLLKHPNISWKQKIMCITFFVNPSLFEWIRDAKLKRMKKQEINT